MPTSLMLVLGASLACDDALQDAVAARLEHVGGPWVLRCLDEQSLEITRVASERVEQRVRVIALDEVSESLRVDVAVMAAQALMRIPTPRSVAPAPMEKARRPLPAGSNAAPEQLDAPDAETWFGTPWSHSMNAEVGPYISLRGAWFPTSQDFSSLIGLGYWMMGGTAGLEWRGLRVGINVWGSHQAYKSIAFDLVSPEMTASLALVCGQWQRSTRGCVRIDFSGGVAHVDYAPKRPWYPMLEGALLVEADHRVGPLWLGVGIEGAGAFGIGVTPDGSPIPWSGFRVGTAITASWAQ